MSGANGYTPEEWFDLRVRMMAEVWVDADHVIFERMFRANGIPWEQPSKESREREIIETLPIARKHLEDYDNRTDR